MEGDQQLCQWKNSVKKSTVRIISFTETSRNCQRMNSSAGKRKISGSWEEEGLGGAGAKRGYEHDEHTLCGFLGVCICQHPSNGPYCMSIMFQ